MIRIGLIGCGAIGRQHAHRLHCETAGVTLTGEMCLWEDEPPIGTGLPMLFDFLDEVRISK